MTSTQKYFDMNSVIKFKFFENFFAYIKQYTDTTGIHGIRYLTEKRSLFEKIFWTFVLLLSLGGCLLMISEIIYKYQHCPVVISFATRDTPLVAVPFPAVTICPESKCFEEKFNYSSVYRQAMDHLRLVNKADLRLFYYVSLVCDSTEQNFLLKNSNMSILNDFFEVIDQLMPNEITICHYMGIDCLKHLVPVLTDQGVCLSFNILDWKDIYRDDVYYYERSKSSTTKSLSYSNDFGYFQNEEIYTYPKRALMSGVDNSLHLEFRHTRYNTDLLCNKYQLGYEVLIHDPFLVPRLRKSYFQVPLDKTVIALVDPKLITTSTAVQKFSPDKRNCYMTYERPLRYFKDYTQGNCLLECETNNTLRTCGCVAYFMPRTENTKICGIGDRACILNVTRELRMKTMKATVSQESDHIDNCDCRPSCTSLSYNVETSINHNPLKDYFKLLNTSEILDLHKDHYSVLSVYFKKDQFIAIERNELYGTSDLISNIGGLLGLFMGFSLISGVELLYYVTLRIFYNNRLYGRWFG